MFTFYSSVFLLGERKLAQCELTLIWCKVALCRLAPETQRADQQNVLAFESSEAEHNASSRSAKPYLPSIQIVSLLADELLSVFRFIHGSSPGE